MSFDWDEDLKCNTCGKEALLKYTNFRDDCTCIDCRAYIGKYEFTCPDCLSKQKPKANPLRED